MPVSISTRAKVVLLEVSLIFDHMGKYRKRKGWHPLGEQSEGSLFFGNSFFEAKTAMENSIAIDQFDFGHADITEAHRAILDEYKKTISGLLLMYPDSFITVWGHTDLVDEEAKNESLGQSRADEVRKYLTTGTDALPETMVSARSMGEREPLIKTQQKDGRNRRVQIMFTPRNFFQPDFDLEPSQPLTGDYNFQLPDDPLLPPSQYQEQPPKYDFNLPKIPDINIPRYTPIEGLLRDDPLINKLPKDIRDKVIDAAKDLDETAADKILDLLPLGGEEKEAVKAVVKSLIQLAKGKKWTPPVPPPYEMPPSGAPKYEPAPGEKIFKLPAIKFDESDLANKFFKLFKPK